MNYKKIVFFFLIIISSNTIIKSMDISINEIPVFLAEPFQIHIAEGVLIGAAASAILLCLSFIFANKIDENLQSIEKKLIDIIYQYLFNCHIFPSHNIILIKKMLHNIDYIRVYSFEDHNQKINPYISAINSDNERLLSILLKHSNSSALPCLLPAIEKKNSQLTTLCLEIMAGGQAPESLRKFIVAAIRSQCTPIIHQIFNHFTASWIIKHDLKIIIDYLNFLHKKSDLNNINTFLCYLANQKNLQLNLFLDTTLLNLNELADIIFKHFNLQLDQKFPSGTTLYHAIPIRLDELGLTEAPLALIKKLKPYNLINITDQEGYTALHIACQYPLQNTAQILLDDCNINPNIQDNEGFTPLHIAVIHHFISVINLLWQRSDIKKHHGNREHVTFFYYLLSTASNTQINQLDIVNKANPEKTTKFMTQELKQIARKKLPDDYPSITNFPDYIDACIFYGGSLTTRDKHNKLPLDYAYKRFIYCTKANHALSQQYAYNETIYHLFVHKTPYITNPELYWLLAKKTLNTDLFRKIMTYYTHVTIDREIARYAQKNPEYYRKTTRHEKEQIKQRLLNPAST